MPYRRIPAWALMACLFTGILFWTARAQPGQDTPASDAARSGVQSAPVLTVDMGHPWRPPFGLGRVGQPTRIVIEPPDKIDNEDQTLLVGYREGVAVLREQIEFSAEFPAIREMDPSIDRVVLLAGSGETWREIASQIIPGREFEAEAIACLETPINPIDLGAVFPRYDWLVLCPGRRALVNVAAFSRTADIPGARVTAWFESQPSPPAEVPLSLSRGIRAQTEMELREPSFDVKGDILQVYIQGPDGKELWHKQIHVMLVKEPPTWPRFGARETKLRYDLPISVRDPQTGALSTMPYEEGWSEELKDVVVFLPNGSRFVFWRGSNYVPFWAGRHNTGLSYEWAETGPLPEGFVDSVEPLMDKELRYGRVSIVESTPARVHVRWTYQSCDFLYKVWGDAAQEDFYFYPDGFGTRVLTLKSTPNADYELSEFIGLAPPEGFPFDLVPADPVRCLGLDGASSSVPIPFVTEKVPPGPKPPLVYRVQLHKEESETAVYFNPRDPFPVEELVTFRPFYERGYMVTPAYWGSHWPLARGKTTGWAIDDRIHVSPSHNSLMSWARRRPEPVWRRTGPSVDTLGRSREMLTQCWVWLIGMTGEPDERLVARARSFSQPAAVEAQGAETGGDPYVPERRAYKLDVEGDKVAITIKPSVSCVNPVFELPGAPKTLGRVTFADRVLRDDEYAWDGQTLWLGVDVDGPAILELEFRK